MRRDVTLVVGALTAALIVCIAGEILLIALGKAAPFILEHSITASLSALAALLARTDKEEIQHASNHPDS